MLSPTSALNIRVKDDPIMAGRAAAAEAAEALRRAQAAQGSARVVFAAAPSQRHLLEALALEEGIDWSRVTAFHMDEYIGLDPGAPQRFGNWLRTAFFDRVPLEAVHLIDPDPAPEAAAGAYARLLAEGPIDLVCLGIGVNGHLAFNDPPVADLDDPQEVKVVELDEICRRQQVDDGGFPDLDQVPRRAITLTIPRLLAADRLVAVVSGKYKSEAVRRTLYDPIGPACPATALRTHPRCTLYLDADAASLLPSGESDEG
ncbi:glucosamine-6-phosphate deaminase [Sphaerisporangium sp. NPDC051017]|uniref:glucosamine-6-phosphate deaminase n=1 Tax=Sphaerisporangium sp. NPDC051017 TaxID=3154636 RepID=UPI00342293C1